MIVSTNKRVNTSQSFLTKIHFSLEAVFVNIFYEKCFY